MLLFLLSPPGNLTLSTSAPHTHMPPPPTAPAPGQPLSRLLFPRLPRLPRTHAHPKLNILKWKLGQHFCTHPPLLPSSGKSGRRIGLLSLPAWCFMTKSCWLCLRLPRGGPPTIQPSGLFSSLRPPSTVLPAGLGGASIHAPRNLITLLTARYLNPFYRCYEISQRLQMCR